MIVLISSLAWIFSCAVLCFYLPRDIVAGSMFLLAILNQSRSLNPVHLAIVAGLCLLGIHFHYLAGPGPVRIGAATIANQTLVMINALAIWFLCHRTIQLERALRICENGMYGYDQDRHQS